MLSLQQEGLLQHIRAVGYFPKALKDMPHDLKCVAVHTQTHTDGSSRARFSSNRLGNNSRDKAWAKGKGQRARLRRKAELQ